MKMISLELSENPDLTKICSLYGIAQITRWEDPLILEYLERDIFIYQFGAIVFFDHSEKEVFDFIAELQNKLEKKIGYGKMDDLNYSINAKPPYEIANWDNEEFIFNQYDEIVYFNEKYFSAKFLKTVAFVLAQSAAIEKYYRLTEELECEVDRAMLWFKKNKLLLPVISNKSLDKTIAILKTRHTIVSDLMINEKPSAAWENSVCSELYETLGRHFELSRRFKNISKKLDYALETYNTFSDIIGHSRANFLELLIVIMILWEIIWEFIKH